MLRYKTLLGEEVYMLTNSLKDAQPFINKNPSLIIEKEINFLTFDCFIASLVTLFITLTACGPSDGKEVKDVSGRPGARLRVGSAR